MVLRKLVFAFLLINTASILTAGTGPMEPEAPSGIEISCKNLSKGTLDSLHFAYRSIYVKYQDGTMLEVLSPTGRVYSPCGSKACVDHTNVQGIVEKGEITSSYRGYFLPFAMKRKSEKVKLRVKLGFSLESAYDIDIRQSFACKRNDI